MATKKKPEPKRAYVLTLTARQARAGEKWTEDFERNNGPGWVQHFPQEARLIRALRAALQREHQVHTCGACKAQYILVESGRVHGDSEARYGCPWCGRHEGESPDGEGA